MLIPLKLVRDEPLQQQLFEQLRDLILAGRLASGTRMPSTRMLADQFAVSRITVLLTYERLIAEGLLETLPAVGTFVRQPAQCDSPAKTDSVPHLGHQPPPEREIGRPDPAEFPAQRWRTLIRGVLDRLGANLGTDRPDGHPELRRAIANWLSTSRGLTASPEQIILTACRQQALYLAAHLLVRPGQHAVVEDPCDRRVESILTRASATLTRVPVDADGLRTDLLPAGGAALIYVTPEHQCPLGTVMSLDRRQALLDWAVLEDVTIVEDDCDGELRYGRMDVPPLMSLDREERVIHAGCFAAALGPGVMLGYLVVPPRLVAAALTARRLIDGRAGWLEEAALAEFLDSGAYALHLHRLRKVYLTRRDTLIGALRQHFGESTEVSGAEAGLYLTWSLPANIGPAAMVADVARRSGLDAVPVAWSPARIGHPTVLLGFGLPADRKIASAVGRMAASLAAGTTGVALSAD